MMDRKEMLEKAIKKAVDRGWTHEYSNRLKSHYYDDNLNYFAPDWDVQVSLEEIIFSHDFAKALWGHETWYFTEFTEWVPASNPDKSQYLIELEAWQYHLQQMVIADDPIAYLGENL